MTEKLSFLMISIKFSPIVKVKTTVNCNKNSTSFYFTYSNHLL